LGEHKLTTPLEIEQLQTEKTRLLEESQALDEELKQLEIRSKILSEKITIQELKNENTTKKQTISQLASKISMLETQLEKLTTAKTPKEEAAKPSENVPNQEAVTETTDTTKDENRQNEDVIRVMALDNEEEISQNVATEQENKGLFY
jgi:hypothetical protein